MIFCWVGGFLRGGQISVSLVVGGSEVVFRWVEEVSGCFLSFSQEAKLVSRVFKSV